MKKSSICLIEIPEGNDRENRGGSCQKVNCNMCEHGWEFQLRSINMRDAL